MTESNPPEALARRNLLGRGAVLAGTAAGAIALGVAGTRPAAAATGDPLITGGYNQCNRPTTLSYEKGEYETRPTLTLTNRFGPALQLQPVTDDTNLRTETGDFFALNERPVYNAFEDGQAFAVGLATLDDIDIVDQPIAHAPQRLLDTTKSYPGEVRDTSNFDASGRLKAGRYVDVTVAQVDQYYTTKGVFLNVHSSGSTTNGVLCVYPPGGAKQTTLHYTKGVSVANFTMSPTVLLDHPDDAPTFCVRVYTSATTHVQLDTLGYISNGLNSEPWPGNVPSPLPHKIKRRKSLARRFNSKLRPPR